LLATTSMLPETMTSRAFNAIDLDDRAVVFLLAATIVTALLVCLPPVLLASRTTVADLLRDASRTATGSIAARRLRSTLVVAEVALALVLLVGAGLLIQSVARLQRVDLGFDPDRLLTFRVELGWAAYGTLEKTTAFHRRVLERLQSLPGVRGVTFDNNLPMSGKPRDPDAVRLAGQSPDEEARNPYVNRHLIGPAYFATMRIPLRSGRELSDFDRPDTFQAAIVSRRLA
jgi:putative ABC transport system permease protein